MEGSLNGGTSEKFLQRLHYERQRPCLSFADLEARGHALEVIRRRPSLRPQGDLTEHVPAGHTVAGLLREPESRGGVYHVVLAGATAPDLDRQHAELPGLHAGHRARFGRGHVAPLLGLREPRRIVTHPRVAALRLDHAREAFERLAARDRAFEDLPRPFGVAPAP